MKSFATILSLIFCLNIIAQEVNTDAAYEKITKEYTLNEDGSTSFHFYKKVKLNTHYSFNRLYGETFIVYNPEYQALEINFSKTTQSDGNVIKAPENAFNEVLPRFANKAPYYNGLREMVVTHTGLEVGAVIELDYTITSKPGFSPGLMSDEILTESSPVAVKEIIIHIPAGTELHHKVYNLRTGPEISESKSHKTYSFRFSGLKENTHEYNQPKDKLHFPRLVFSTKTFSEAIAFLTDQPAFQYKINDEMKSVVASLKEKSKDDLELILELQKITAENSNIYFIPPKYTGYNIRTPIETWNSNGGTPCEKSLLLLSLLREAGIHAKPMAVINTKLFDENTGCLPLMENLLIQVNPRDKEQMYISAVKTSDQNIIFSMNNKTLISLDPTKFAFESINENFKNKVITNGSFVFDSTFKMKGNMETSLTENVNPYYKIKGDSVYVKSLIGGGISKGDIVSYEVLNSAQFRSLVQFNIEKKEPPKQQANYYFIEMPENKRGTSSWHITSLNSERLTPYELPGTIDEQYSYTIILKEGVDLINPLSLIEKKTKFAELVLSTTQDKNKVTVKRMLIINRSQITVEEYPDFKEIMDMWNEKNYKNLIFKVN